MPNETFNRSLEWLEVFSFNGKIEQLQVPTPVAIAFVLALCFVARKLFANHTLDQFYKSQPCAGRDPQQWFSGVRATLRSFFHNAEQVKEGYVKVSFSPFIPIHVHR